MAALRTLENSNVTILIHDDYCCNVNTADISQILLEIGVLISNSYCHAESSRIEILDVSSGKS